MQLMFASRVDFDLSVGGARTYGTRPVGLAGGAEAHRDVNVAITAP